MMPTPARRLVRAARALAAASLVGAAAPPHAPAPPPPHADAATAVLALLDSVPLVAITDLHAAAEMGAFYQRLIRHPRFASRVNDVIVEFGNELYQPLADRWVAGADVPADSLRMIWENNTQGPLLTTSAPMYADVLHAVRAVNAGRPAVRRVRVLLGDPGVEWRTVTRDELWEIHKRRGDRMRELARDSVLARGRRGLILAGGAHIRRVPRAAGAPGDAKWGELADRVFVVRVHEGFGGAAARFEPVLDSLPPYSFLHVRGTFLASLAVDDVDAAIPAPGAPAPASAPPGARSATAGLTLADVADGYLYLAPFRSLTVSRPDVERIRRDPARLAELHRRSCMMMGRPLDTARTFRTPSSALLNPGAGRRSMIDWLPDAPPPERAPPLPPTLPEPCGTLLRAPR